MYGGEKKTQYRRNNFFVFFSKITFYNFKFEISLQWNNKLMVMYLVRLHFPSNTLTNEALFLSRDFKKTFCQISQCFFLTCSSIVWRDLDFLCPLSPHLEVKATILPPRTVLRVSYNNYQWDWFILICRNFFILISMTYLKGKYSRRNFLSCHELAVLCFLQ